MPEQDERDQALTLARIEVKLDTLIAANSDHEGRIRALEQKPAIESHGYVTGRQMWGAVVGCGTLLSAAAATITLIVR